VIFAVSFLGALFAILVALLVVYTYVMLRLLPRLWQGLRSFVEEVGPSAVFERANLDPAEALRQLGISPTAAAASIAVANDEIARRRGAADTVRRDGDTARRDGDTVHVVFTCEDHGRCAGCPRVLAQFEAIIRHQGADSFDEIERKCYERLVGDALLDGEGETDRQRRIAARVVEALVREGFSSGMARGVVWACGKEERVTFAGWLSAARVGCQTRSIQDKENVA
jgi:hypothetical protein